MCLQFQYNVPLKMITYAATTKKNWVKSTYGTLSGELDTKIMPNRVGAVSHSCTAITMTPINNITNNNYNNNEHQQKSINRILLFDRRASLDLLDLLSKFDRICENENSRKQFKWNAQTVQSTTTTTISTAATAATAPLSTPLPEPQQHHGQWAIASTYTRSFWSMLQTTFY